MWAGIHLNRRQITEIKDLFLQFMNKMEDDFKIFQLEQLEWV